MRRPFTLLPVIVVALVALAGCGSGAGTDQQARDQQDGKQAQDRRTQQPAAGVSPPPASLAPPGNPEEEDIWPGGMGPYLVGAPLTNLKSDGQVDEIEQVKGCPGYEAAEGTRKHHNPTLTFHDGQLVSLSVDTPLARTTEGARVAMTLSVIKQKYPDGERLSGGPDGDAWFVVDGDNALLFRLGSAGTVDSIEAGAAQILRTRYATGKDC